MISVCIATYNGEKYIFEQISSILSQLGKDDEVIISDDGSTDDTIKIIESICDNRVRLLINNGKHGFVSNFEKALMKSKGDFIFLSDQDDIWKSNKVQVVLKSLNKYDLVVHDADLIDGNGVAKSNTSVTLDILLENTINYTAFQLDIVTPSHLSVNSAKLSGRCIGHDLYFIEKEPNNYSIYCFSPVGDDIEGYSGILLTLDISSTKKVSDDDIISLKEINFVDQDEKVYRRHEKSINLIGNTAIENITNDDSDLPVNVYNTQGQLLRQNIPASEATQGLPAGIYIVGNKKVIVR